MKKLSLLFLALFLSACSSMIPYKNQNLDYLHGIEENPDDYRGKVVSFGGKVKGVTEDTRRMRLIIKIDVPFYYYATGKDPLSYELLLISFDKKGMPQMTGIQKGSNVKVLARVANYETRKNLTGKPIAVLHLIAFALADRDREQDFFRPEPPCKQLYESWKAGRLFFNEQPQEIEERYPAPQRKTLEFFPQFIHPRQDTQKPAEKGIVYDDEEPAFILPPDPKPAARQADSTPADNAGPTDDANDADTTPPTSGTSEQVSTVTEAAQSQTQADKLPNPKPEIPRPEPNTADLENKREPTQTTAKEPADQTADTPHPEQNSPAEILSYGTETPEQISAAASYQTSPAQ